MQALKPSLQYVGEKGVYFRSDCLELLKNVKSDSIDLVFTDPPFNLGKDYLNPRFKDLIPAAEYEEWCRKWLSELIRVLKPGGTLAVYSLPKWAIDMGSWLNKRPEIRFRNLIALKNKSGFPIRGRLHPAHYSILYYVKNGAKETFHVVRQKMPLCRKCGAEIRDYGGYRHKFEKYEDADGIPWIRISDLWEDTRPARQDKAQKRTVNELGFFIPERIILMGSNEGDVVLDIFGGGGSTFHSAQNHGRYWIGCDINPEPALGRFATVFGRQESESISQKVRACFENGFLQDQLMTKKKRRDFPVRKASVPKNGHYLTRYQVESKSKVLGI